jgi:hypothetical protein
MISSPKRRPEKISIFFMVVHISHRMVKFMAITRDVPFHSENKVKVAELAASLNQPLLRSDPVHTDFSASAVYPNFYKFVLGMALIKSHRETSVSLKPKLVLAFIGGCAVLMIATGQYFT